ncbi:MULTISPECIES: aminotransferase class IV [unclassified Streptomyces]|uniref:aminotransferase class IV n=1 Tax=unclassified Streptomyces TaxID=2593676 RepID=UPI00382C76A8
MTTALPVGERRRWSADGGFRPAPVGGPVDVVDSWLVSDGRVVAPEAHAERFTGACAALFSVPGERTSAFLRAAARRVPASGRWFPRMELTVVEGEFVFHLWVRPAPARGTGVRVWVYDGPDRRLHPTVKGPDLEWLTRVRSAALGRGADEAVLLSGDGLLVEGATTALLWWRDDTLCVPDATRLDLLPSVTRRSLLRIAADSGTRVVDVCDRPEDVSGLETWAVNALHGIRPVRAWAGAAVTAGPAPRAALWQARLEASAAVPHPA